MGRQHLGLAVASHREFQPPDAPRALTPEDAALLFCLGSAATLAPRVRRELRLFQ